MIKGTFVNMHSRYMEATERVYYYRVNNNHHCPKRPRNGAIPGIWRKGFLWRRLPLVEGCSWEGISAINTTLFLSSFFLSYLCQGSPLAKLHWQLEVKAACWCSPSAIWVEVRVEKCGEWIWKGRQRISFIRWEFNLTWRTS